MKPIFCCLALVLVCACSKTTDTYAAEKEKPAKPPVTQPTAPVSKPVTPPAKPPAAAPVATDTSNDPADIELVARLRKVLVDDSALSVAAKNVVIVVKAGEVTLRGQVPTEAEKTRVYELATAVAGVGVENQIEVKP